MSTKIAPRGGYMGQILRVDLSTGVFKEEKLDPEKVALYLGGAGLGGRLLMDEVPASVSAFDPENRLIFLSGPFTGTAVPGSGTYTVTTKGVMTDLITTAQANGMFGARLKFSGYDGIIFQGASQNLVYLIIDDGKVELRDASELKGMMTVETQDYLKDKLNLPRASVACIGPAGENLVYFANIGNDMGHFASTNGVGAVMGSKNLKAIVVNGKKKVPIYNEEEFVKTAKLWNKEAQKAIMGSTVSSVGTIGFITPATVTGWIPIKNCTTNIFEEHPYFNGDYVRSIVKSKRRPCHACPLHHSTTIEIQDEPHKGLQLDEPEYEGLAGFGPLIGNKNLNEALKLCKEVDNLGMDLKECSFSIALAIECYEDGILTDEDTGGLELKWGNVEAVSELMSQISKREGFGALLADGVYRMAQKIGPEADKKAMYTHRGLAPHVHDPRGMWGYLLGQVVSNFGSIEGMSPAEMVVEPDIGIYEPVEQYKDPMRLVEAQTDMSRFGGFIESSGICHFTRVGIPRMLDALNTLTGFNWDKQDLLDLGQRIAATTKLFNIRHGWTKEEDIVSPRLLEACPDGPNEGYSIEEHLEGMIDKWYELMGWDDEGHPKEETLKKLKIEELAK
jgi:aldehyde:ferredoxin oxidoreductase